MNRCGHECSIIRVFYGLASEEQLVEVGIFGTRDEGIQATRYPENAGAQGGRGITRQGHSATSGDSRDPNAWCVGDGIGQCQCQLVWCGRGAKGHSPRAGVHQRAVAVELENPKCSQAVVDGNGIAVSEVRPRKDNVWREQVIVVEVHNQLIAGLHQGSRRRARDRLRNDRSDLRCQIQFEKDWRHILAIVDAVLRQVANCTASKDLTIDVVRATAIRVAQGKQRMIAEYIDAIQIVRQCVGEANDDFVLLRCRRRAQEAGLNDDVVCAGQRNCRNWRFGGIRRCQNPIGIA